MLSRFTDVCMTGNGVRARPYLGQLVTVGQPSGLGVARVVNQDEPKGTNVHSKADFV